MRGHVAVRGDAAALPSVLGPVDPKRVDADVSLSLYSVMGSRLALKLFAAIRRGH